MQQQVTAALELPCRSEPELFFAGGNPATYRRLI